MILLAVVAILAALEWQHAVIRETGLVVSITGFESFPQIGLFLLLQLVAIFGSRYWSIRTARFAVVLVGLVSALAIAPVAASVSNGSQEMLRLKVESSTGISDWISQVQILDALKTNELAIWGIVAAMLLLIFLSVLSAFNRRAAGPKKQTDWLN